MSLKRIRRAHCARREFWKRTPISTLVVVVLTGGVVWTVAAVSGTPSRVDRQVISSGGDAGQSATRRVSGTIGQIASERGTSATLHFGAGFWNAAPACDCRYHGDLNGDGVIDVLDVVLVVTATFRGGSPPPKDPFCPHANRGDVNCDDILDVLDVVRIVNTAFRGGGALCDPCRR